MQAGTTAGCVKTLQSTCRAISGEMRHNLRINTSSEVLQHPRQRIKRNKHTSRQHLCTTSKFCAPTACEQSTLIALVKPANMTTFNAYIRAHDNDAAAMVPKRCIQTPSIRSNVPVPRYRSKSAHSDKNSRCCWCRAEPTVLLHPPFAQLSAPITAETRLVCKSALVFAICRYW